MSDYEDMLTVKDLCEYLNISPNTAYEFIKAAPVVVIKVGRAYRISRKSLADYFHSEV